MKREGYLMEKIADPDNLRWAFWKAQRGKSAKAEVRNYQKGLDKNLMRLREELLAGAVSVGNYHYFKVYDPKERQICAAAFSERVLHHALMNVCHANFEKYQIHDSYASRLGKGTFAALKRAHSFQRKYRWFLKLDVRKFFDSIDHEVLKALLLKRFKEAGLLAVFAAIIDSYHTQSAKGVPIGNLTSQYFANHYLAVGDHFIKETLGIEGYVRYMDDMVLWSNDKTKLHQKGRQLSTFLGADLKLELKPFCLNKVSAGLPFLGYLVYPFTVRLNRNSRDRFVKKLNLYERNITNAVWNQGDYQRHVLPLLSFVKHAESAGFRRKWLQSHS
ncbi:MAG: RNA-directed DNA polymerase [Spirosomataceae bacterium]